MLKLIILSSLALLLLPEYVSADNAGTFQNGYPPGVSETKAQKIDYQYSAPIDNQNSFADNQQTENYQQPQLTMEQRVRKLEGQVSNLQQTSSATQIQSLQQQIQDLRGQIQLQAHDLEKLTQQVQAIYNVIRSHRHNNEKSPAVQSENPSLQSAASGSSLNVSTSNNFLSDQDSYEAGYKLLSNKKYSQAIAAFENYVKQYPTGAYAANAYYWLGELYLIQNNNQSALRAFKIVIEKFPNDEKYPAAMLKVGFIYDDSGQYAKARAQLREVEKRFPGSTVARLAAARLQTLKHQTAATADAAQEAQAQTPSSQPQAATAAQNVSSPPRDNQSNSAAGDQQSATQQGRQAPQSNNSNNDQQLAAQQDQQSQSDDSQQSSSQVPPGQTNIPQSAQYSDSQLGDPADSDD